MNADPVTSFPETQNAFVSTLIPFQVFMVRLETVCADGWWLMFVAEFFLRTGNYRWLDGLLLPAVPLCSLGGVWFAQQW